jgi:hypothetical protein
MPLSGRRRETWKTSSNDPAGKLRHELEATDMSKEKVVYWWVSVSGAHAEPAVIKGRMVYTFGCSDAFNLDDPNCPAVLIDEDSGGRMEDPPQTPAQEKYRLRKQREWMRTHPHCYRRDLLHH